MEFRFLNVHSQESKFHIKGTFSAENGKNSATFQKLQLKFPKE
jgi:hypothetical protein